MSWDERGKQRRQVLSGPDGGIKLIEHADVYALEMAMAWIDSQLTEDVVT
ncbi:MAG TPA: hypothetical protein VMT22_09245 [Terriglobales bacterium]|nr:hypothetical protein [Terriglobales bacterium]